LEGGGEGLDFGEEGDGNSEKLEDSFRSILWGGKLFVGVFLKLYEKRENNCYNLAKEKKKKTKKNSKK